jgi:hypothetical protein
LILQRPCSMCDAGATRTMFLGLRHKSRQKGTDAQGHGAGCPSTSIASTCIWLTPPPFLPVEGERHLNPPWLQAAQHVAPTPALAHPACTTCCVPPLMRSTCCQKPPWYHATPDTHTTHVSEQQVIDTGAGSWGARHHCLHTCCLYSMPCHRWHQEASTSDDMAPHSDTSVCSERSSRAYAQAQAQTGLWVPQRSTPSGS